MITRCKHCNKPLALNDAAWASRDGMYCSKECGIADACKMYPESDDDRASKAAAYFNDIAEEIGREDYGAKVDTTTAYLDTEDITVIFKHVYEGDTCVCTSIVGFYFGEPTEELTDVFNDSLTAIFVD